MIYYAIAFLAGTSIGFVLGARFGSAVQRGKQIDAIRPVPPEGGFIRSLN